MPGPRPSPIVLVDGDRLEVQDTDGREPALVFLHEGLGSIGLWRGFDQQVAGATRRRAISYSRAGHGWSGPASLPRSPDFMDHEALVVLTALLEQMGLGKPPILIGHSDGASIALIHAASHPVSALVLLAPHVFVEPESIASIRVARVRFETTDLRERMARHHHDPAATFYGWNDIWLDPGFGDWNIEDRLPAIDCPTLLIQGADDEYGTMAQIDAIEEGLSGPVSHLILEECGHSPHLAQPERVLEAVARFVRESR